MHAAAPLYRRHRFPAEIISHTVWLYFRFALSFRDVEEIMAVRGIVVSYEAIREWCRKFGQTYAKDLRRRRPRSGDRWHLDEVFIKINGRVVTRIRGWKFPMLKVKDLRNQLLQTCGFDARKLLILRI